MSECKQNQHAAFRYAHHKVMRAVERIKTLTGTERELGSDRIITEEIYHDLKGDISQWLDRIHKMTPPSTGKVSTIA